MWACLQLGKRRPQAMKRNMKANTGEPWHWEEKKRRIGLEREKTKTKHNQVVISFAYCGEEIGELLCSIHYLLSMNNYSFFYMFDNFILIFLIYLLLEAPQLTLLVSTQPAASVTCLSSSYTVPWAFTSCQSCHYSIPVSIKGVTFLIDTFRNWLTFHFCFKPNKSIPLDQVEKYSWEETGKMKMTGNKILLLHVERYWNQTG